MRLVLALLTAGMVAGSATAATVQRTEYTVRGTNAARATLLGKGDLGAGWTSRPQSGAVTGIRLTCRGFRPKQNDVVVIGVAETPSYSGGQVGPYLLQKTSVYKSAAHARRLWERAVRPALADCVAADIRGLSSRGLDVSITSARMLAFPKVTSKAALYRVIAAVSSPTQRLTLYFDVVLIANGRTISQVTISQYQTAPGVKLEQRLARVVAQRIGATPAA